MCCLLELVLRLLSSMPRAQIARIHRRIAPSVQVDIVSVRWHPCSPFTPFHVETIY